ncbi:MAG: MarR family winged helix-turn-helix transcriptional regulator [Actinomycetes bacterium]
MAEALRPLLTSLVLVLRKENARNGVPSAQAIALGILADGHSRRMSELAEGAQVTQPSMSVLVDRMERQGWVIRQVDQRDRRVVNVTMTPAGMAVVGRLRVARLELLSSRIEMLPIEEQQQLAGALPALTDLVGLLGSATLSPATATATP